MRLSSTLSNNQRKNFVKKFFFLIRYQIIKTNNNNYCWQEHGIIDTDIESADWRKNWYKLSTEQFVNMFHQSLKGAYPFWQFYFKEIYPKAFIREVHNARLEFCSLQHYGYENLEITHVYNIREAGTYPMAQSHNGKRKAIVTLLNYLEVFYHSICRFLMQWPSNSLGNA